MPATLNDDERAFQDALDRDPSDHVTRQVFADWLQERGDPRAEGYRALGRLRREPDMAGWFWMHDQNWHKFHSRTIPSDWYENILGTPGDGCWHTRKRAEDAAALAFAKLPASRRAELLA